MAISIACLSQKGGVGKSTLSRLIARTYAGAGWTVKICDFNTKQKTSVDWAALRMSSQIAPEIAAEAFTNVKSALKQDFDLLVLDGRPDSDTTSLDCARGAAVTVIPTSVTFDDLKPQVLFAHELIAKGVDRRRVVFVLNRTGDSQAAIRDARAYIESAGYFVLQHDLPARTAYEIAQNSGYSVSETTFATLKERADAIAGEIVDRVNELEKLV